MNVVVTGSTGLIGAALVANLRADGHDVRRLVRRAPAAADERQWEPASGRLDPDVLAEVDVVVHLAGAGIGDKRWTQQYKRLVLDSRVEGTSTIARAVAERPADKPLLLSASGVGYYGDTDEEAVDETAGRGAGFLADVVERWEQATRAASDAGARVVLLRSGIVLSPKGGALGKVLPIFKLGLGGRLGSGRQWMSWIALADHIAAIRFLIDQTGISGPVNLTAPEPARNRDYTKAIARAVRRPALLPVPAAALRLALGDFADEGVLVSLRVLPARLEAAGFRGSYDDVDAALRAIID
jgi:uncharacterized protein (TIGR01777 family)